MYTCVRVCVCGGRPSARVNKDSRGRTDFRLETLKIMRNVYTKVHLTCHCSGSSYRSGNKNKCNKKACTNDNGCICLTAFYGLAAQTPTHPQAGVNNAPHLFAASTRGMCMCVCLCTFCKFIQKLFAIFWHWHRWQRTSNYLEFCVPRYKQPVQQQINYVGMHTNIGVYDGVGVYICVYNC